MENGADWGRLGKEVLARRHALGVSQEELARRGGPSHQSIRNIEAGGQQGYRELTLAKLEMVLGWRPGTVQAIINGTAGDDPDAWVHPAAQVGEVLQDAGLAMWLATTPRFRGQPIERSVSDSAPAVDSARAITASQGGSCALGLVGAAEGPVPFVPYEFQPGTPEAKQMQQVVAAVRALFQLEPTPTVEAAKRAMIEVIYEVIQRATADSGQHEQEGDS